MVKVPIVAISSSDNTNDYQSSLNDFFAVKYIIIWLCYKLFRALLFKDLLMEISIDFCKPPWKVCLKQKGNVTLNNFQLCLVCK